MKRRKGIPPAPDAKASPPRGADTLQAQVDAGRALDVDTTPPPKPEVPSPPKPEAVVDPDFVPPPGYAPLPPSGADTASPTDILQYPPAYIPPGAIIYCVPDGHHKHPDGVFWPFPPTPRGLRVAEQAWQAMHTPSELSPDTLWTDLILPYLDGEAREGPFPSLGSVRESAKSYLMSQKLPVPHDRTIEKRIRKHRPEWIKG